MLCPNPCPGCPTLLSSALSHSAKRLTRPAVSRCLSACQRSLGKASELLQPSGSSEAAENNSSLEDACGDPNLFAQNWSECDTGVGSDRRANFGNPRPHHLKSFCFVFRFGQICELNFYSVCPKCVCVVCVQDGVCACISPCSAHIARISGREVSSVPAGVSH